MIEPAGSAIDRLVPELQAGGFKRVKSSNYQEEFKRGDGRTDRRGYQGLWSCNVL